MLMLAIPEERRIVSAAMPRLTSNDFLTHRQFLVEEWFEHDGGLFTELPRQYQIDLHDYYAPSVGLTEREALAHRKAMTSAFPSLPQRAGRAYQALEAVSTGTPNRIVDEFREKSTTVEMIGGTKRGLRIAVLARPKPDHHRLAHLLLEVAKQDTDGKLLARAKKIARRQSRHR